MNSPICDFVSRYVASDPLRLHMPGHKGTPLLGVEAMDITEIDGADSLFEAGGIIRKSEENASMLFDCPTFYSTEGSSLCIRAMLYLCMLYAKQEGKRPLIAAARNAHSTFIRAAAMLDFDIHWLYGSRKDGYLSCVIDPEQLNHWLGGEETPPAAVYLTSPDYLGNIADIRRISQVCHRYGVLLIVDNAHGAYLKFLPHSEHPIDLGADLCCDSAHKTLPVLTGGAYLHISKYAPKLFASMAKQALSLFGSTSPSYLILQSLDAVNHYLFDNYPEQLANFLPLCKQIKAELNCHGYAFLGNEPLKWTIDCKSYGYTGIQLAQRLKEANICAEFSDPDFLVLMLAPEIGTDGLQRLKTALTKTPRLPALLCEPPIPSTGKPVMTPRMATFSPCETISVENSSGRILASPSVGCPPAVPIIVSGEQIDRNTISCFKYYGIETCCVIIP